MSPTTMKFEIPFDEEIYDKQTKLFFKDAWKIIIYRNTGYFVFGLFFFIWGILTLNSANKTSIILIALSTYFLITALGIIERYIKAKRAFKKETDKLKFLYASSNAVIWEFNDLIFDSKT